MTSRCLSLLLFFVVVYMLFPRRQKLRRALKLWKNFWGVSWHLVLGRKGSEAAWVCRLRKFFCF